MKINEDVRKHASEVFPKSKSSRPAWWQIAELVEKGADVYAKA